MGCNCGKSRNQKIEYRVNYNDGGSSTFSTLKEAQNDLRSHSGAGRISKIRS